MTNYSLFVSDSDSLNLIRDYYTYESITNWDNRTCSAFFLKLDEMKFTEILDLISIDFHPFVLEMGDIPEFSSFRHTLDVPQVIIESGRPCANWKELGYLLDPKEKRDASHRKYGENHGKIAEKLGLCYTKKYNGNDCFFISSLGFAFYKLSSETQERIAPKLVLRTKIMQNYYVQGCPSNMMDDWLSLFQSPHTRARRHSNCVKFIKITQKMYYDEF